jgi:type I restriction enzyme S subunit
MVEIETKVQRYERYIDSGVEWLGEVPKHWDLTRLGTRFKERKTKVSDKDFPPLSVTKNGTVPQLANAAKSNDGDNRKLVKKGDFAINSRSDRKGSSGIAYQDGSVSLIYIIMEPLNIHHIYCNYLLKSYNFIEEFYRMGHGIVADLWTTRYDEMKAIMVGIPPLSEQTAIAQFLDAKTKKIDEAITIKQQQISLLKERKQILIHKAVTQGLNPNVILKDSGVEWIGEIPEHWEVCYFKRVLSSIKDGTHGTYQRVGEGRVFLSAKNVHSNEIKISEEESLISEKDFLEITRNGYPRKGDLLVTCVGTIGRAFVYNRDNPIAFQRSVAFLRINNLKGTSEFYKFYVESTIYQFALKQLTKTSAQGGVYMGDIQNSLIILPPISEQKEIVNYLDAGTKKIETAISLKQQEIAKLKEYKSSLINSVVTGKVKVC